MKINKRCENCFMAQMRMGVDLSNGKFNEDPWEWVCRSNQEKECLGNPRTNIETGTAVEQMENQSRA